jgi:hypothetical protein
MSILVYEGLKMTFSDSRSKLNIKIATLKISKSNERSSLKKYAYQI